MVPLTYEKSCLSISQVNSTVEWVDVGTRPKVRWTDVVFHFKKIRQISTDLYSKNHAFLGHALYKGQKQCFRNMSFMVIKRRRI
jgi:hypothetical protein